MQAVGLERWETVVHSDPGKGKWLCKERAAIELKMDARREGSFPK